jgi:hypothetical protein
MKKNYFFTILFTFPLISFSQITITENNVIGVSDVIEQGIDTSGIFIHPQGGNDQEWDFLNVQEHLSDVLAIGAAQWFNGASYFPDANVATEGDDGNEIFLRKNSDALDLLGIYGDLFDSGDDEAIYFDPQNRIISFPSTMGTTFTNTFSFSFVNYDVPNIDSMTIELTTEQNSEIDGWGEVTTPFGTFEVIRQVVQEIQTVDITGYLFGNAIFTDQEEVTSYISRYWSNDPNTGFPVVEYNFDPVSNEISGHIDWMKSAPISQVAENTFSAVQLYPNPATDKVSIVGVTQGQYILIFDLLGNEVMHSIAQTESETLSISKLKTGSYFVKVYDASGEAIGVKKLVKN